MTAEPQESFVVEYPCEKFCRVEVALDDAHGQMTLGWMRKTANAEHARLHPLAHRDPVTAKFQAP